MKLLASIFFVFVSSSAWAGDMSDLEISKMIGTRLKTFEAGLANGKPELSWVKIERCTTLIEAIPNTFSSFSDKQYCITGGYSVNLCIDSACFETSSANFYFKIPKSKKSGAGLESIHFQLKNNTEVSFDGFGKSLKKTELKRGTNDAPLTRTFYKLKRNTIIVWEQKYPGYGDYSKRAISISNSDWANQDTNIEKQIRQKTAADKARAKAEKKRLDGE